MKNLYLLLFIFLTLSARQMLAMGDRVLFIENKGQVLNTEGGSCAEVLFHAESSGMGIFLKQTSLSYVFQQYPEIKIEKLDSIYSAADLYVKAHRVDMHFVGANTNAEILKEAASMARFNFYRENVDVADVLGYEKLNYTNLYNNIDLKFYTAKPGHMKYDFVVNPGGNPDDITLYYTGTENVSVINGVLKVQTDLGLVTETMPRVYQEINNTIVDVKAEYVMKDGMVKFKIGRYNKNVSLIIDPWVTFVGGSRYDFPYGINVDNAGNTTIIGSTNPVLFPLTPGAFQTNYGGGTWDMFVTKFNNAGVLVFSTLLGGAGDDIGYGVASDATGNIFVTGSSNSWGLGTPGVIQPTRTAGTDALIAKFSPTGARLWLSYYGGWNTDRGTAINVDNNGNVVVGGSTEGGIVLSAGAFQPAYAGAQDAFVLKLDNNGATRIFCTYIGGSGLELINDMDINTATNEIGIIGNTTSPNFPASAAAHNTTSQGGTDAFVFRMDAAGARVWATYFGGSAGDAGYGVAFDAVGDIAFCTTTFSNSLPTGAGAYQSNINGPYNAYLGKFNAVGVFQWGTYFGIGMTEGYGVAINKTNNDIYFSGDVYWSGLPTWNCAYQVNDGGGQVMAPPFQPGEDQFIARFDKNGKYKCNTYVGGFGHDDATGGNGGNVSYFNGDVFICATSTGAYNTTANAFQTVYGGGSSDAVIARICGNTCGDNTVATNFSSSADSVCTGSAVNFSDISILCDTSNAKWFWYFSGAIPSTSTQQHPSNIVYNTQGTFSVKLLIETPCGKDSILMPNKIFVAEPQVSINVVHHVTCFGNNNGGASTGVLGGVMPYTYSWSPAAGTNNSISNLPAGSYSITVTDKLGCISTDSVTITEPAQLTAVAVVLANAGCSGVEGVLSASVNGGTPAYTYSWNSSPSQATANASNLTPGVYTVTVTDGYGCTATATETVVPMPISPLNVVVNSPSSVCIGDAAVLSATGSGGSGVYSYYWLPVNSTGSMITVSPASTTTYTVIINDICNNTPDTTLVSITVNELPLVSFSASDSLGCAPLCLTLSNTTPNSNSVVWGLGDGTTSTLNNITHCYSNPGDYTVSLLVTDNNGCSAQHTKTNYIHVYPVPTAMFSQNHSTVNQLDPTVHFTDKSIGTSLWQWSFGDVANSSSSFQNPVFTYPDTGIYEVSLVVTNEFGCSDTAYGAIYVQPSFTFYLPNSFSPNGDGLNDEFKVSGMGIKQNGFELIIFDRWGNLIFNTNDFNKGWNGMFNNEPVQIDTYVWKISAISIEGERVLRVGHVNLLR